ncbi:YkvI family membrane protein [Thermaerobacter litoralis]
MAATFIGTVVGAGFASGQEILTFFTLYGPPGTAGLLLVAVAFAVGGRWWLELGARTGARSYRDALAAMAGPWAGGVLDGLLAAALFTGVGVMTAGAAAVTADQLGWPLWAGRLLFALLCAVTVWRGLPGVLAANVTVVPVLVGTVILVSVYGLATAPAASPEVPAAPPTASWNRDDAAGPVPPPGTAAPAPLPPPSGLRPPVGPGAPGEPVPPAGPVPARPVLAPHGDGPAAPPARHWWLAAWLYAGFNLLLSLPVLVPLGAAAPAAARRWGSLAGGTGLAGLALLLHLAMLAHMPGPATREIPVLHLAAGLPPWFRGILAGVLWTEIFTTAVGSLYGFASRLGGPGTRPYRLAVAGTAAAALAVAEVGFAHLVRVLYPLLGWLGLGLMAALLFPHRAALRRR